MAHHGQDDENIRKLIGGFKKELEHARTEEFLKEALGDTGQYPQGALTKDDEGELRFAVGKHKDKVVVSFGKPVAWIGFDADQAMQVGQLLIRRAAEIKGVQISIRLGRDE